MEWLIAKIYELLIRKKVKTKPVKFEYSILTGSGFTEEYIKPNTLNRVTVYFYRWWWSSKEVHLTFKNIKEAYKYFK